MELSSEPQNELQANSSFIKTETATLELCLYNNLTERIKTSKHEM